MSALLRRLILLCLIVAPLASEVDQDGSDALAQAKSLFEERRYAEAQESFETLFADYPHHPEILMYLGKLAAKRQEREQAVDYLGKAVELVPDDAQLHFEYAAACGFYAGTLGTNLKALNYARRASKSMQKAIELEPDNLEYRIGFIEFSLEAPGIAGGGSKRARAQADAIAERDPVRGAFAWAMIHRDEGDHAAALEVFDGLIALAPDNYFALFNFGRCAAESGLRLDEGLARLQQCLELPAPDQAAPPAHVWWNIATIQKQRGDRPGAITALEQAIALAPNDQRIAKDLERYLAEG